MGEQVVLPLKVAWISKAVEFDSKLCIRDANSRLIATLHFNSHVVGEYLHVGEGFSEEAWQIAHLFCAAPEQQVENAHLRTLLARATCIQIVAHGEPYCPLCGFMVEVAGVFYHQDDCEGQVALKEETDA